MIRVEVLLERIEESRQLLYQLGSEYGLQHPKVLRQSMDLDELLNRYNNIKYGKYAKPATQTISFHETCNLNQGMPEFIQDY